MNEMTVKKRKIKTTITILLLNIILLTACNNSASKKSKYTPDDIDIPGAPSGNDVISSSTNFSGKESDTAPDLNGYAGAAYIKAPQINNYGAVSLAYPIEVPDGRAGVQPAVGLSYSSSSGDGLVGIGWNIATGLGVISRTTQYGKIYYDKRDTFTFNGKRLVKVSGSDFNENGTYRLEIESGFSKLVLTDIENGGVWTVYDKAGTITIFGETASSKIYHPANDKNTYIWNFTRSYDLNGNYMVAEYDTSEYQTNNILYVKKISYTGNYTTGASARQYVKFHYKDRDEFYISKASGFIMKMTKLLDKIEVGFDEEELWHYSMVYRKTDGITNVYDSNRERLVKIESDHYTTAPEFEYKKVDHHFRRVSVENPAYKQLSNLESTEAQFFEGDVDGNGISDMIYFDYETGKFNVMLRDHQGVSSNRTFGEFKDFNNKEDILWFKGNVTGDYDGNGKSDIAFMHKQTKEVYVMLSNGESYQKRKYANLSNYNIDIFKCEWFTGDYDANGLSDALLFDEPTGRWILMRNMGESFELTITAINFKNLFREDYKVSATTFNSMLTSDYSENGLDRRKVHFMTGDYTGNNATDICIFDERSGNWYIGEHDADFNGNFSIIFKLYKKFSNEELEILFPENRLFGQDQFSGDFNGDGLSDFIFLNRDTNQWIIAETTPATINFKIYSEIPSVVGEITKFFQGDFNGDGRTDVGMYSKDENFIWFAIAQPSGFRYIKALSTATWPNKGNILDAPLPEDNVEIKKSIAVVSNSQQETILNYQYNNNKNQGKGEKIFYGNFTDDKTKTNVIVYKESEKKFYLNNKDVLEGEETVEEISLLNNLASHNIKILNNEKTIKYNDKDAILYYTQKDEENSFNVITGTGGVVESITTFNNEKISNFDINNSVYFVDNFDTQTGVLVLNNLEVEEAKFILFENDQNYDLTISGDLNSNDFTDVNSLKKNYKFFSGKFNSEAAQILMVDMKEDTHIWYLATVDKIESKINFKRLNSSIDFNYNGYNNHYKASLNTLIYVYYNEQNVIFNKLKITENTITEVHDYSINLIEKNLTFRNDYDINNNPLLYGNQIAKRLNMEKSIVSLEDFNQEVFTTNLKRSDLVKEKYNYNWIQGDFNGDNKTDIGFYNINDLKWYYALSVNEIPDMLNKVYNGIGGTYEMKYANTTSFDNTGEDDIPDLPMNYKVCIELKISDGIVKKLDDESQHEIVTKYKYENGFAFSKFINGKKETDFFGFSKFTILDAEGRQNVTIYNASPYEDYRMNRALAGAVKESYLYAQGTDGLPHIFNKTEHEYKIHKIVPSLTNDERSVVSYLIEPVAIKSYQLNESTNKLDLIKNAKSNIVLADNKYEMISKTESITDHYSDNVHKVTTINNYSEYENIEETNEMRLILKHDYAGSNKQIITNNNYDDRGNLIKTIVKAANAKDKIIKNEYDSYGNIIRIIDASDSPHRINEKEYDTLNQYVVVEKAFAPETVITTKYKINYNQAFGQIEEKIDPNGNSTYYEYDNYARLIKQSVDTDDGKKVLSVYDYGKFQPNHYEDNYFLSAKVTQYTGTSDNALQTRVYVDGMGRVLHSVSSAYNNKFVRSGRLVYDKLGRVVKKHQTIWATSNEIDEYVRNNYEKHATITSYDKRGRIKKVTLPPCEGEKKSTYTEYNYQTPWQTTVTHSIGRGKTTIKNAREQILYVIDSGKGDDGKNINAAIGFAYDLQGNRVKKMDTSANSVQVTGMNIAIDQNLFTVGVKDQSGKNICQWKYNGFGQVLEESDADLGYKKYTYNGFGDVVSVTDALNRKTEKVYDTVGRLLVKILPNGEGAVAYKYDYLPGSDNAVGKVTSITDTTQSKIFSYDTIGRVKKERRIVLANEEEFVTEFKHDLLNRQKYIKYPKSRINDERVEVTYNYSAMGVRSIRTDYNSKHNYIVQSIEYNEFGQMNKVLRGNNLQTDYTYDARGRLKHLVTSAKYNGRLEKIQNVTYKFNLDNSIKNVENNPTYISDGFIKTKTRYEYSYDGLNRLIGATGLYEKNNTNSTQISRFKKGYRYENNGNLLEKSTYNVNTNKVENSLLYSYNNHSATHVYSTKLKGDKLLMKYDACGNMTDQYDKEQDLRKVMRYDSNNRIISVAKPDEQIKLGEYWYDDQGFRVRKLSHKNGWVKETIYPSKYFGIEREKVDVANGFIDESAETGGISYKSNNEVNNIYLNGVRIAAIDQKGRTQYYHTDQVDSVKVVTSEYGIPVTNTEYMPYGETWFQEGDKKNGPKYNSQQLDKESGFYFYNARHYDAVIARFVTPDTVIDGEFSVSGWNRYMYCKGNPILYKDPSGHDVVILNSETGANGAGHTAMLVEISDGGYKGSWMYISKNGITKSGKRPVDGPSYLAIDPEDATSINHEQIFDSPEDFFKKQKEAVSNYEKAIKDGKGKKELSKETLEYVSKHGKVRYEEGFRIQTSKSADKDIMKKGFKYNRRNYHLASYLGIISGGNCNDLVDDAIDSHVPYTSDNLIPKNWYKSMKEKYSKEYDKKVINNKFIHDQKEKFIYK